MEKTDQEILTEADKQLYAFLTVEADTDEVNNNVAILHDVLISMDYVLLGACFKDLGWVYLNKNPLRNQTLFDYGNENVWCNPKILICYAYEKIAK